MRVFPSYLQTGKNFLIEKAKQRMVADDIRRAFAWLEKEQTHATVETVLEQLTALADPGKLEGMAHFALVGEKRLGIPVPPLRRLANNSAKIMLWHSLVQSGYSEARILASMIDVPIR
jgi:hypothetical protein